MDRLSHVSTTKGLQSITSYLSSGKPRRIFLIFLTIITVWLWANMVARATRGHGSQYDDFVEFSQDLFYHQINIYKTYDFMSTSIGKYPPFFAAVYAPLVPFPLPVGAAIWFLVSLLMAILACRMVILLVWEMSGEVRPPPIRFMWAIPFILGIVVIITNLETAQVNIFIFALILLGLYQFSQRKDAWAGLLLGTATAIKLTPGLFIAYFLYKREWKTVFWSGLGVVLCWGVLLPLLLGPSQYLTIMQSWLETVLPFVTQGTIAEGITGFRHTNQSLSAFLYRFFTETPADGRDFYVNLMSISYETADLIMKVLKVFILLGLMYVCRTPTGNRKDARLPMEMSLVAIATLYLSPISWINHYIVMILPYGTAFYYVWSRDVNDPRRTWMMKMLMLSVFLVWMIHPLIMAFSLPFFGSLLLSIALARGILLEKKRTLETSKVL